MSPDADDAAVVLDLYARTYQGVALGADEYVISADEKPSIQARDRCHATAPAGKGQALRVNHDYRRRGALAYLAAYDVRHGRVFGRCATATGITAFTALVDHVMSQEPYASARRVFWIVDNRSTHRGQAAIDRLNTQYPNAIMVHTPVHASWLNQVEIYFSIIQRKVLSPNDVADLDAVEQRLLAFEDRYNATAIPFKWKYTTTDLNRHLERLDQHERATHAA
ncbi:transposase [Mycobacterium sp. 21AC1]|uniref:transposase n=1 Tax=[Mycobacterium] appelbergii TaxID=2939269 RepID=UPI0029391E96|nr:transposase [Mycobacterium sp. 21AC1]MDV3125939.1 transposase [Mycobacterium sp. 21AC1]